MFITTKSRINQAIVFLPFLWKLDLNKHDIKSVDNFELGDKTL